MQVGHKKRGNLDYCCQTTQLTFLPLKKASELDSMATIEQGVEQLIQGRVVLIVDHACPLAILTMEKFVQQVGQLSENEQSPIIDIASREVVCCQAKTSIQDSLDLMHRKKVTDIVVYEEEKLLGVLNPQVVLSYFLSLCERHSKEKVVEQMYIEGLIQ